MRIAAALSFAIWLPAVGTFVRASDFNRDVRPILAKHCLTCHGPDEDAREAGLRLDTQSGSREDMGGYAAVAPGDIETSELLVRVTSDDPDLRMPPADSHAPLSDRDVGILRDWIAAGAQYEQHWAFVPPKQVPPPNSLGAKSAIDAFIQDALQANDLRPTEPTDKASWLRRVHLDLSSTVPTLEETQRFIADEHPLARRRVVDRLLASPDFGEKFTRQWLDLARYADTNGYEKDRPRTIWPYRDWVLDAINADMPFDQFSIEQLAGDMLPGATNRQRIATGFHRNTMLNEEGGIDPLEYRWLAVVDRVATTGTTWLGLTTGCAQCHTHKYDPITHTDYYQWFALLNQADEPELEVRGDPSVREQPNTQELDAKRQIDAAYEALAEQHFANGGEHTKEFEAFLDQETLAFLTWQRLTPASWESTTPILSKLNDDSLLASGDVSKRDVYTIRFQLPKTDAPIQALQLDVLPHESLPASGPGMAYYEGRRGDFFLSEVLARVDGEPVRLIDATHSFGKLSVGSGSADAANVLDGDGSTGWSTSTAAGNANRLVLNFDEPVRPRDESKGELEIKLLFERHFAAALGRFAVSITTGDQTAKALHLPTDLANQLNKSPDDQTLIGQARAFFARTSPDFKELRKPIDRLSESLVRPRTLVMKQRTSEQLRTTHRHNRGEYLQPQEVVDGDNLTIFGSLSPHYTQDRLGLARFLVSNDNPLVGRVQMNRLWRHFFATGIVKTAGDFGTQSESPSHPKLLDWLAVDWISHGWSTKRSIRNLVLSSTYGQTIAPPPETDPANRLLSVFPYRRMDAESIRDSMLSASRLLSRQWGGASVHPPQPASVSTLAYGKPDWKTSEGANRYRRSLYTFARRTAPFAAFTTFDGPTGEQCIARRDTSTNPLQALTLLNDGMFMEFARALADDVIRRNPTASVPEIGRTLFQRVLVRAPSNEEQQAINGFYEETHDWTLVARALLNTDEAITIP